MDGSVRERERERASERLSERMHATSLTAAAARLNSGVCLWTVWTACALLTRANSGHTARAIQFAADTRSHRLCVVRASASFPYRSFVRFVSYTKNSRSSRSVIVAIGCARFRFPATPARHGIGLKISKIYGSKEIIIIVAYEK